MDNFDHQFREEIDKWVGDKKETFTPNFNNRHHENTEITRPITIEEMTHHLKKAKKKSAPVI